jgi:oligoribonuclease (3'-5' exoribonuclease)
MDKYDSPFDMKKESKKIKEAAKLITDPALKKAMVDYETRALKAHSDMLRKMSGFVNSKSKNGAYKK